MSPEQNRISGQNKMGTLTRRAATLLSHHLYIQDLDLQMDYLPGLEVHV